MEIREGHNKFYINDEQGKQIAEIVFVPTGENLAIIEHTDVDESLKGQGICFIFWGKTVQCWQSNSLTKQSVQNDCPCRFRNSFFKGKQHEN